MVRVPDPRQHTNPFVAFNTFGAQVPLSTPDGEHFGGPVQYGNSEDPRPPFLLQRVWHNDT